LLKDKVNELKELFSELSYDELTTLRFVTNKSKSDKAKRKYTKKKKEAENEEEVPQIEETNTVEEKIEE
jgi:hypothetical protein